MKNVLKMLPVTFTFLSSIAFAGQNDYQCTVVNAMDVNETGNSELASSTNKRPILKDYIGSKFMIDRATGKITGELVTNQTPNAVSTKVLNNRTGSNAYRVISEFGPNPSILYIQVNDFGQSKNSNSIPFIGFRWSEAFTGVCK
jgi:hypothetical protein